ncbi:hypothetical protein GNI_162370 [Gregarina niphandrodes]|uniref:Uncharacterized protein n=1 Tax=Gregarina niphandrodes TaxID=110365 RepID=A0A023AYH1_GRENI|nr:hypothetical protein GNI_162370 [Gregarina niphandrodes]EZG43694.1 hypothetical protein GNI_162370 [Gregarina niphandrodes]|eukprot:XP_011133077.1 hypothetical protein GNI_162370 [Gregarina niphandrodes]
MRVSSLLGSASLFNRSPASLLHSIQSALERWRPSSVNLRKRPRLVDWSEADAALQRYWDCLATDATASLEQSFLGGNDRQNALQRCDGFAVAQALHRAGLDQTAPGLTQEDTVVVDIQGQRNDLSKVLNPFHQTIVYKLPSEGSIVLKRPELANDFCRAWPRPRRRSTSWTLRPEDAYKYLRLFKQVHLGFQSGAVYKRGHTLFASNRARSEEHREEI